MDAAKINAALLLILTLFAPLLFNVTAPAKLLLAPLVVKLIALAPALKLEVPATVNAPLWLIAPFAVTLKFWPIVDAPKINAVLLVMLALFAPLLLRDTAPVKLLLVPLLVKSIALAPALKLEVPPTVSAPL